jgi:hypothetical protein
MIRVAEHISGTTGIVITVLEKLSRFQIQMSGTPVSFNRRVFLAAVRQRRPWLSRKSPPSVIDLLVVGEGHKIFAGKLFQGFAGWRPIASFAAGRQAFAYVAKCTPIVLPKAPHPI